MAKKTIFEKIKDSNTNKKLKIRSKNYAQKRNSFFLDYYFNNKHHFIFPKKYFIGDEANSLEDNENLKWVQIFRDELERRLNQGEDIFNTTFASDSINFISYLDKYSSENQNHPMYNGLKVQLVNFLNSDFTFKDITPTFCKNFSDYLLLKVKASTAKTYISTFKAILNNAEKEDIIKSNPCKNISIKAEEAKKEFLTSDELLMLISIREENEKLLNPFLFSCFTGLRLSDLINLTWDNINGDYLYIRQKKTKSLINNLMTKDALSILEFQKSKINKSNKVFELSSDRNKLNSNLREIIHKAGINKHISFHCSRHTAAILWIGAGIDIYVVQKLLGHQNIQTTMVYAKLLDKVRDEYVTKMPQLI